MIGVILAVVVIIAVIIFGLMGAKQIKRPGARLEKVPVPADFGIQMDALRPIVRELDQAMTSTYASNVKQRFMREHPKVENHEFDWSFFELKRYFVMNRLLKSVPMFSHRADELWHEMLMFTKEYERFSKQFFGEPLHHIPNMDVTPIPGERGFFDWVYLSLFESTPNSRVIWGGFLKHAIKAEIIDDFRHLSEDALLDKYFRQSKEWLHIQLDLIKKFKDEIVESEQMKVSNGRPASLDSSSSEAQWFYYAAGAAVFYSMYESDRFQHLMGELLPDEYYKAAAAGSGSACSSGFACGSSSGKDTGGDSGSDSGGDSGGGSSCSSCGGGCSS